MRIEELDTPALIVHLDILESNIRSLSAYARDHYLRLRPHTKTHKIPAIAKMQIASRCSGITVAKVGEAEVMADAGIADILIHYPVLALPNWRGSSKSPNRERSRLPWTRWWPPRRFRKPLLRPR